MFDLFEEQSHINYLYMINPEMNVMDYWNKICAVITVEIDDELYRLIQT